MDDADRILELYKIMIYYSMGLRYYCAAALASRARYVGGAIAEFYEDHVQCYRDRAGIALNVYVERSKCELLARDDDRGS